jgi:hypothetical protein
MVLQLYDMSSIVSVAKDIGIACRVVILTPIVYLIVVGSSIGDDYLPSHDQPAAALLTTYALLGIVTWHGWRRGGIDRITCLAIATFWVINAFLLGTYWIAENYQYAATFGLIVGTVSAPLLVALVRASLPCEQNTRLQLSLRAFLSQRRFTERPPRRRTGWRSFWHYLEFTGVFLAALYWTVHVSAKLDHPMFKNNPLMAGTIQYGLTIPLFVYAFKHKRLAEQLRALSIEESRDIDRRAPILFLRSFADDDIHVQTSSILLTNRMPLECLVTDPKFWGRLVRFEEVLAKALWEIGPVVAIGAPSEEIPQLGAIRSYYADTSWQSKVTALMRRARLVLVIPSGSRWVQWEIETLRELGLVAKIIFLLPPGAVTTQTERWKSMMCAVDIDGGAEPLQGFDPNVRAMVVHDNMCVALTSTELDEMVLTLIAKGAADLALRRHHA